MYSEAGNLERQLMRGTIFILQVNEKIQFTVTAEQTDGAWDVSCHFTIRGEQYNMATYRRSGVNPMQTMACFIEDYGRHSGAMGLMDCRSARYFFVSLH